MKNKIYNARKSRLDVFQLLGLILNQILRSLFAKKVRIIAILFFAFSQITLAQNLDFVKNISNSDGTIQVADIALDGSGNVFVAGTYDALQSIDFDPGAGTGEPRFAVNFAQGSIEDIYVAKYDASGNFIWVMAIYQQVSQGLEFGGIEVDASDNCYIAGTVRGITSAMVLPVTGSNFQIGGANSLGSDYEAPFIIKVNSGGVKQWHVNPDVSTSSTRITGLSLSGSNVIVAGTYFNGSPIGLPISTSPAVDSYAAAYSQSTGALLSSDRLVKSIASSTSDVDDMKIDASGNIFVTGIYKNNTSFGATDIDGGSSGRTYVAKYNISYVLQWVKNEYGRGQVLELANDGNVWIGRTDDANPAVIENWSSSGVKSGTSIDLTFVPNAMSIDSDDDIYVSAGNSASLNGDFNKYSGTDGAQIFAYDIGADAMVIDANDRLHLSDRYKTTTDFDLGAGTTSLGISDNDHDLFLFVYNNNDVTAPAPVTYAPLDNATGVSISNNLTLTFDEAIQLGTGSAILKNLSTNAIIPSASTVSESTLIINPSSSLVNGTPFYVEIASGVVQDLTGNNYAGFSGNTTWNFTTIDIMAPSTVTFVPVDNAINIGVSNNLTLTFNENIQLTGSAVLKNISGSIIPSASSVSGSTLTINPNSNLSNSTQYYVELASGVIQGLSGNSHTGFNGSTFWNFTTEAVADVAAPTVSSFLPLDNATGVAIEANLVVTFNENVQTISGGGIQIKLGSATTESFVLPHASVTFSGSTITINPTNNFNYGSDYHIVIFNDAVEDIAGNNFAGFTDATTWNFTAEAAPDVTAPAPVTYVPADNATGISVSNNLTLTFNEAIQLTGSAVLKNFAGSVIPSSSSVSESTLTINPTSNLAGGVQYYVEIASGVIKDLTDNSYAGFTGNSTWNFTSFGVVDATAPLPVTFVPADNSTDISISNDLTLTFDEAIQLTGGAVLKTLAGSVIPSSSTVSGSTLTINPTSDLLNSTQYYVELASGVIKDLAGNSYTGFNGSVFWNFTTEAAISDITAPIASSFLPLDNTTGVAIEANLVVTFNENMTPVSGGSIQIKTGSGGGVEFFLLPNAKVTFSGSTITINPTNDFNYSSDYYVVINNIGVQDIAENRFAGFTDAATWNFTTVAPTDVTVPAPVTYVPADNATGISISNNLTLTFDEAIQLTGGAVLKTFAGSVISSSSSVSGSTLTINPTSSLVNSTQYYVELANGVIQDLAGNSYAGFSGNSAWNFTTVAVADVTAPTSNTFTPLDNAAGVSVSINLTLTFNEAIQLTGGAVLKQTDGAIIPSSSSVSGSTLTINPTSNLVGTTQYYVEIASGVIKDLAGNSYAGFSGSTNWNFATASADVTAPSPVTFTPLDNATGVSISNNLTLAFDEHIKLTGEAVLKQAGGAIIPSSSTLSSTSSGGTLIINPTSNLVGSTQYYVEIASGIIKDLVGNSYTGFSGSSAWNFTTAAPDVTAPAPVTYTPLDNATGVSVSNNLTLAFDESITVTGEAVLKNLAGSIIPSSSTVSGSTLTINPTSSLVNSTQYYVEIASGVIKDIAGNSYAGFNGGTNWNFTTVDVTAPIVTTLTPNDGATDIALDATISVLFDEPIKVAISGATKQAVIKRANGSDFEVVALTSGNISGNTLTLPHANLEYGQAYYIYFDNAVIADLSNNWFGGITNSATWNFTTVSAPDITAPAPVTYVPADNSTEVSISNNLTLAFDENITVTGGAVLKQTGGAIIPSSSSVSGSTLTINPTSSLVNSTQYYVELANGVIQDLAGNSYAGFSGNSAWNFTTVAIADVTAPTSNTFTPLDNAAGVSVSINLTLTFNEAIQLTGGAVLKQTDGAIIPSSSSVSGSTLTINPTSNLVGTTQYYVEIASGVIKDLAGNSYAGFSGSTNWNFATASADVTAPSPVTFTPLDNATGVSISNNLTLAFDEHIKLTGEAVLKQAGGAIIPSSSTLSSTSSGGTLIINPTSNLVGSTQYYVEITSGIIKDLVGNSYTGFSGSSAWNFTTAAPDVTAPAPVTFTPLDNATGVSVSNNLTLAFDESITVTGEAVLKSLAGSIIPSSSTVSGSTLTINPTSSLVNSTQYYVEIASGVIKDIAGNSYAGFSGGTNWNFTTVDVTAPIVTTLTPNDGATDIALDATISVLFDEPIKVAISGATKQAVIKRANGSDFEVVALTSGNISGNTLTIPHANLEYGQAYYIYFGNAVIADLSNNWFGGITNSATWNFTTVSAPDITAPAPVTYVPADNSTEVSISNNLTLAFDENITVTGGAVLKQTGGAIIPSSSSVSGSTLTINPTSSLVNSTQYYVEIASGVIKDAVGNSYTGFSGVSAWNFTTADVTAPVITTLTPNDESTDVALDAIISVLFDEPIKLAISGATKIALIKRADASTFEAVTLTSANFSGNTLTIPHANLKPGVSYYINIANGVIADLAGNWFAGISNPTTWNFTAAGIADVTAPVVTTLTPNDESTNVALDATISVLFDEPIELGVNGATKQAVIKRANASDFEVVALTSANISGNTLTLPHTNLEYGQGYYITFNDGVIVDLENNLFGGITNSATWNFTTVSAPDVTAPAPVTYVPTDNTIGVSISNDLTLTFDEAIQLTGGAVLKQTDGAIIPSSSSVSGSTLTINPTSSLVNSTQYYVEIASGVIKDAVGNSYTGFSGVSAWNFTTADVTAPVITTLTPNDESTNVALDATISVLFDEPIKLAISGATKIALIKRADASTFEAVTLTSANFSGNTLTIPHANLKPGVSYYINIANGVIANLAGNWFAGISNPTTWNFTAAGIADVTAPIVTTLTPNDESTNVALDATISVLFDEPIELGVNGATKQAVIKRANASDFEVVALTSANISGNTLTLPHTNLEYGQGYYITFNDGVIVDLENNLFGGITNSATWNFTTVSAPDVTAPAPVTYVPTDNTIGVSISNDLTLTFDEAIQLTGGAVLKQTDGAIIPSSSSVSGSTLTINPTSSLVNSTQYYVELASGVIKDLAGNTHAGFSGSSAWNFTTKKVDQTISFANLSSKVYGDNVFSLTASSSLNVSYVSSNLLVATVSGSVVTIVGAGTTTITASQGGNSQFNAALDVNQILVVNKATLTATADDKSRQFGLANPALTIAYVGFKNGDTDAVIDTKPTASTTATTATAEGGVAITLAGGSDSNYSFTLVNGTLTITAKATPTLTFADLSKTYGDVNFDLAATTNSTGVVSYSIVGAANGSVLSGTGNKTLNVGNTGTVTIKASVAESANHAAASTTITLTIGKATLTATAENKTREYGTAIPVLTIKYVGFKNGETNAVIDTKPTASTTAVAATNVGVVDITLAGGVDNNYNITLVKGTLTIGKAILTATADDKSRQFGLANPALTITYAGFKNGDTDAVIDTKPTASTTATTTTAVGTAPITLAGGVDNNYSITLVNGKLTITEKVKVTPTFTFVNISKTYGDANFDLAATSNSTGAITYSLVGASNGTALSGTKTINVGNAGAVTIKASVAESANHTAASKTITLTIGKAILTATADDKSRQVGEANPALTITYAGFKNGDTDAVIDTKPTASTTATTTTAVGTAPITLAGGVDNNYSITLVNGKLTITEKVKVTPTFTFVNISKTYGDANFDLAATSNSTGAITYSLVGASNGTALSGTKTINVGNAGAVTIKASVAESANHTTASKTITLTIDKAILTATADDKSRQVGEVNPALTITYAGFKNGDTDAVIDTKPTASTTATTTTAVGTAPITLAGGVDNNYSITLVNGKLTITEKVKVTPTLTFVNISKTYGDANFDLAATSNSTGAITYSLVGAANGTSLSGTKTINVGNAGAVTIKASVAESANHTAASKTITLTIDKAILTATADDKSRQVGEANPALTITYAGFKNGDTDAVIDTKPTASTTATTTTAVGTAPITLAGGVDNNYSITLVNGKLTITEKVKVTPTFTFVNISKTYGDANFDLAATSNSTGAITYSLVGAANGTALSGTKTINVGNAGAVTIKASVAESANHTAASKTITLTIGKAILTATADDKSRQVGEANPALTITYAGFKNGDTDAVIDTKPTASTTATTTTAVGTAPITLAGGVDNNYSITLVNGKLTITEKVKVTPTLTFVNISKTYGDANFDLAATSNSTGAITYSLVGASNGTSLSGTKTINVGNAGAVTIKASVAESANHTAASKTITLTIGKAILTATADDKSRQVGEANPALTITYAGFKNGDTDAVIDTKPTASTTATTTTAVGSAPITLAGGVDNNYSITLVNGKLTITEKVKVTPTFTFVNISKTYGDANFDLAATSNSTGAITYSLVGASNGTSLSGTKTINVGNAGAVTIKASVAESANHTAASKTITLTIDKAILTATADDKSRQIGEANPALTITYAGFKNGDTDAVIDTKPTASTTATTTTAVGSAPITLAGGVDNNYSFTLVNGKLTITEKVKVTPTFTFVNISKTYGDANFDLAATSNSTGAITYSLVGAANGTALSGTKTINVGNAGAITIKASVAESANHTAASKTITLTIDKAILTATADDKSREVGEANPALTITYADFKNGDTDAVIDTKPTASTTATTTTAVGTAPITLAGGVDNNYSITLVNGILTITAKEKMEQTINFAALADKVFGNDLFDLTATTTSSLVITYISSDLLVATIDGTKVTIVGAGSTTITASQGGDDNFLAAAEVSQTLTVSKADQVITITAIADKTSTEAAFDVVATTTSNLELSYQIEGSAATIVGKTISLEGGPGTVQVTVAQAGNANYKSATSETTFVVTAVLAIAEVINVQIYPNPASEWLQIAGRVEPVQVDVFDLRGVSRLSQLLAVDEPLELRGLETGFYVIKLTHNSSTTTAKILIQQ